MESRLILTINYWERKAVTYLQSTIENGHQLKYLQSTIENGQQLNYLQSTIENGQPFNTYTQLLRMESR